MREARALLRHRAALAALAASDRAPIVKPARFREICDVDIDALRHMLSAIPTAEWADEDAAKENKFPVFRQTQHIVARFSDPSGGPETYHSNGFWHRWEHVLAPALDRIAACYRLERPDYSKVMLARLVAGGRIDSHRDVGLSNHLTHKIHVPLVTNGEVRFTIDGETFHLPEGKAYELNNLAPHAVRNDGAQDRVHLIFELFDAALTD